MDPLSPCRLSPPSLHLFVSLTSQSLTSGLLEHAFQFNSCKWLFQRPQSGTELLLSSTRIMQSCFCHLALLPLWGCMLITARRCSPLVPRVAECTEMFGWKMWDLILVDHGHKNRIFTNVVERNALKPPYIVILFWKSPQNIYFTVLSQGFNLNVFTQEDYLCSSFHVRVQRAILCNADDSVDWVVSSGELRSHNDFSRSLS